MTSKKQFGIVGLSAVFVFFGIIDSAVANDTATPETQVYTSVLTPEGKARTYLHQLQESYMTPSQRTDLNQLAYHGAASVLCEKISLNRSKFDQEISQILRSDYEELGDEQQKLLSQKILISYGASLGVMLAENANTAAQFCTEAQEYRDLHPEDHLFELAEG